jgi:hypothetical protein
MVIMDQEINIPEEELERIVSAMMKTLEMGICAVYGDEDDDVPDAAVDCESRLPECRAKCCTYHFALTKDEVRRGIIKHDPKRPFFIARDEDGYCPHLNRTTLRCRVWQDRPLRCRRYDCTESD